MAQRWIGVVVALLGCNIEIDGATPANNDIVTFGQLNVYQESTAPDPLHPTIHTQCNEEADCLDLRFPVPICPRSNRVISF